MGESFSACTEQAYKHDVLYADDAGANHLSGMCLSMLEKEYRAQCAEGRRSGVCFLASSLLTQRRRLADASRIKMLLI